MPNFRKCYHLAFYFMSLLILGLLFTCDGQVRAANDVPPFILPLAAPWPAGVTLHSAGDGYGYGPGPTHRNTDLYAMDFNGWLKPKDDIPETNDKNVLVLSVADGCVKEVSYKKGSYVKDKDGNDVWVGNYGWNIVVSHVGGYEIRYAHLKEPPFVPLASYNLDKCYFVSQGTPLGQIGGTGTENDSAVHLHLAIYYCAPSNQKCSVQSVLPEPLDGASSLTDYTKITSKNYGVGFEAMVGEGITDLLKNQFHPAINQVYKDFGGQIGFF